MANRENGEGGTSVHKKYALDLTLSMGVMCLFAIFHGFIWPPLASRLAVHAVIDALIRLSTQAGIGFYALYQIPRTIRMFYRDWRAR